MAAAGPRVGCGAAVVVDGRILLVRRLTEPEAGRWSLPGGKIDLFETAAAATEREILEKVGIEIAATELLCLMEQIDPARGEHWVAPIYLVTRFTGEPANLEPAKHGSIGWFDLDDLPTALATAAATAVRALAKRQTGLS